MVVNAVRYQKLMLGQPLPMLSTVRSFSSRHLRVPDTHSLLSAMARLPCLQCGHPTEQSHSQSVVINDVLAKRVKCGHKQLPLACSRECADTLQTTKSELLNQYDSMMEDVEYSATHKAIQLFTEVLQPSRRKSTTWVNNQHLGSWTDYLNLYHPHKCWLSDTTALRLLSSAYSYVMTLSRFLQQLIAPHHEGEIKLHVVGARAEAMMPRYLWDELLFFHPGRRFSIKLVGDHVPVMSERKMAPTTRETENPFIQLEMINGLYHEIQAGKLSTPDAFVLYNPGIGHPNLRKSWEPTVLTVLASRKPVLITSYNLIDQERDIAALQDLVAKRHGCELKFRLEAIENPFRSLKFQIDPCKVGTPIQTNSRVMVVQLVSPHEERNVDLVTNDVNVTW